MPEQKKRSDAHSIIEALGLEARILLASSELSPAALERSCREGRIAVQAPASALAWLEVGGVVIGEGRMVGGRGHESFVLTRLFASSEGGRS